MARMIYSKIKNKLKSALLTLRNLTDSVRSRSAYFDRLLSFSSSSGASETELHTTASGGDIPNRRTDGPVAAAGGDIEAGRSVNEVVQVRQRDVPAADAGSEGRRTIPELAIPAALSMAVYSSIPPDVQIHHGAGAGAGVRFLYYPLIVSIALAIGSSFGIIIYALMKFDGGGREAEAEAVESAKRRWMGVSIVFFLLAFMLRIFLLL